MFSKHIKINDYSGWLDNDGLFIEQLELEQNDMLVAVENMYGDVNVYVLGHDGFVLDNIELMEYVFDITKEY